MKRLTHPSSIRWIHEANSSIKVPGYLLHDTNLTKLEFLLLCSRTAQSCIDFFCPRPAVTTRAAAQMHLGCSPCVPVWSRLSYLTGFVFFRSLFFCTFRARATSPFLVLLSRIFKIKWSGADRKGGNDGLTLILVSLALFFLSAKAVVYTGLVARTMNYLCSSRSG